MAALSDATIAASVLSNLSSDAKNARTSEIVHEITAQTVAYLTQPVAAALTVNAEAANVITVDIALKDTQGTAVASALNCLCTLYDADMDVAGVAAFHLGESGAGAEVTTTDRPVIIITTSAAGAAQLEVTDVAGASGATKYLTVEVMSDGNVAGLTTQTSVTFD